MISIEQISGEIAALEDEKPTHVIMQKLAALYTVRDHMTLDASPVVQSVVVADTIPDTMSDSEFLTAISGKPIRAVLDVMDELMQTLQLTNPRLYDGVMRKL